MAGKRIVARIVSRYGHDGARAVACQHIVGDPHGDFAAREGVDGIRTREDARHAAVGNAFALGALLRGFEVGFHLGALAVGGELLDEFALGGQHHEGHTKDGVGTGGEDGKLQVAVLHAELHLRAFAAANPVALGLLDGFGPVNSLQSIEQALCVGRHAEAPLAHLLLHHGMATALAHAVHHLVVGQHRAQGGAPVHHRFAQIGNAVVHQHFLLLHLAHGLPFLSREAEFLAAGSVEVGRALFVEMLHEALNRLCALALLAVEGLEHLLEGPLRPVVIVAVAGADFAVPVEAEPDVVELFAIAVDIVDGRNGGMLARLDGILFGGKSVGIVAHGVEHVEALQSLVAGVDIGGDIAQGVTYVEASARGIGEHVEHIEFLLRFIYFNVVSFLSGPSLSPLFLNVFKVIVHGGCNYFGQR